MYELPMPAFSAARDWTPPGHGLPDLPMCGSWAIASGRWPPP